LRRKNSELIGEKRKLQERVAVLMAEARDPADPSPMAKFIRENAPRLRPFEPGSPEWQAELAKIESEIIVEDSAPARAAKLEKMNAEILRLMRNAEASTLANALARAGSAKVLLPFIAERIEVVPQGDEYAVKFRGADGTETTADGVAAEFMRDPALSPLIHQSQALSARNAEQHAKRVAETLGQPFRAA
jgi:hypothetical protein